MTVEPIFTIANIIENLSDALTHLSHEQINYVDDTREKFSTLSEKLYEISDELRDLGN